MNAIVLTMIAVVTTFDYLARQAWLPRMVKYLPELFSVIVLIYVIAAGVRNRFRFIRPAYWFAFGAIVIVMICGAVANALESGPMFAGVRAYLRAMPLFFLPAVYVFSERQVRNQLLLLLVLCVPQLPIAINQRYFALWMGDRSGDYVSGTLLISGILSIFLVCAACVLTAAFLRKRISLGVFLPLFALIIAPTTINETKVTALLLPFGLLTLFIANSRPGERLKNAVVATGLLALSAAIFVPIYDHFISQKGPSITEFFTEKEHLDRYLNKNATVGVQGLDEVGRVDAIRVPLREMAREPTRLVFGLGIGNASRSSLGRQFNGNYFDEFGPFLKSAASSFILEIGLLGLGLALLINFLIYRDSRAVADRDQGIMGLLATGWTGVAVVITMATFYTNLDASVAVSYLFWYFSGLIAAHRVRLALQ